MAFWGRVHPHFARICHEYSLGGMSLFSLTPNQRP
jgi:hypothetical protein